MGGPSVPSAPTLAGQSATDQQALTNLNTLNSYGQQGSGFAQNIINNPYQGQYQQGAQNAANYLGNIAVPQLQGASNNLYASAPSANAAAQQILNTGFDPQNQLYSRTQQQQADQTNAQLAQSGVAQTPYGAAVASQNNANFNIDWQNQQLARQAQAASAYSGLEQSGINQYGAAAGLGGQAVSGLQQQGALPYSTFNNIQGQNFGALGQAAGLTNSAQNADMGYLGQAETDYGGQMAQYNAQNQQYQQMWQTIGSLFGGNLLGGGGGGGSGGSLGGIAGLAALL